MEVRNCKVCGSLFNYIGGAPLCAACQRDADNKFDQVKQYIYDNPNANIHKVAEDNEVTIGQLKKWVKEERLEFTETSAAMLDCESCGTPIRTGRFCNMCKDKIQNKLGSVYQEKKPEVKKQTKERDRMRFLDN